MSNEFCYNRNMFIEKKKEARLWTSALIAASLATLGLTAYAVENSGNTQLARLTDKTCRLYDANTMQPEKLPGSYPEGHVAVYADTNKGIEHSYSGQIIQNGSNYQLEIPGADNLRAIYIVAPKLGNLATSRGCESPTVIDGQQSLTVNLPVSG